MAWVMRANNEAVVRLIRRPLRLSLAAPIAIVAALSFPGLASGSGAGKLVLTISGLPRGEQAVVVLRGRPRHYLIRIRSRRTIRLPGGRYSLAVKPVVSGRAHRGVQRGAIAYPARKRVTVTIKPSSTTKVAVRYAGVVNKGVRRIPNRI